MGYKHSILNRQLPNILLVLLLIAAHHGCTKVRERRDNGWAPKSFPLREVKERCRFNLVLPSQIPQGYSLRRTEIVWVARSPWYPQLPPRQAVHLLYIGKGEHDRFSIIQAEHEPAANPHDNLYSIVSQGYFKIPVKKDTVLKFGTRSGVDFLVVSRSLSDQELCRLADGISQVEDTARP